MSKALVLLSGGLDSILALRLVLDQGVDVEAIHFVSFFSPGGFAAARRIARRFGVPLTAVNFSGDLIEILRGPRHGFGKNANPCIDCRIAEMKRAAERMGRAGASFLVTGEVVGERPMSQRREALRLIDQEAGVAGTVLRPLSAKLLDPTRPEQEGIIDREKLHAIEGRSRLPQMELAGRFGIEDYPSPAGGCLLTDPAFGKKMLDLIRHKPGFDANDAHLLKMGRHFRLSPTAKVLVGRDEKDNDRIVTFARGGDVLLEAADVPGPMSLLRGADDPVAVETAAALTLRHMKVASRSSMKVNYRTKSGEKRGVLVASPIADKEMERMRI